jgi:hypothetical protein
MVYSKKFIGHLFHKCFSEDAFVFNKPKYFFVKYILSVILIISMMAGSCKKELKRLELVTTDSIYKIDTSVFITGTIVDEGEGIDNYGYCWSLNPEPLITNDTSSFNGLKHDLHFTSKLRNLKAGKTYYIRPYTKSKNRVTYGNTLSFFYGYMIFWNKLEDSVKIQQSEIGPGIKTINYKIKNWEEGQFLPAKFGNGLFINQDTIEGMAYNGANFFAIDAAAIKLSANCGTIEFWFVFKCSSTLFNDAYFFDFANKFTDHFPNKATNTNTYLSAGWHGLEVSGDNKYFFFTIGNAKTNTAITIKSKDLIKFKNGDVCHFAFVWDSDGISGSQETMRVYMNGDVIASASQHWDPSSLVDRYMYLGAMPGYDEFDQKSNAVKGITDNIRIFNFANVLFNDKEN